MTPAFVVQGSPPLEQPHPESPSQLQSHQQWWETFKEGISSRKGSDVSPAKQQCWDEFKHDMYLHTSSSPRGDPYGFTSAGPSREATPKVEQCWEDLKHKLYLKVGSRLEKDPYGFSSAGSTREHTPVPSGKVVK